MTHVALHDVPSPTTAPRAPCAATSAAPGAAHADITSGGWISLTGATRVAGVNWRTLRKAVLRGELSGVLISGRWYLRLTDVRAWGAARRAARGGQPERRGRPYRRSITATCTKEETDGK